MNPTSKAFGISLAFHTFMALIAITILMAMQNPPEPFSLPLKHMTLVPLDESPDSALTPLHHTVEPTHAPSPKMVKSPVPPLPAKSPVLPETITPLVSQPAAPSAVSTPAATAPQAMESSHKASPLSPSAKIAAPLPKAQPKVDIGAEKQTFFAFLRTKIQQNLRYPASARRRGIEGEVSVRFVMENSGMIRDIAIMRGESIFHEAAKHAVASASGVKVPEILTDTLPAEIDLTLEFRLN